MDLGLNWLPLHWGWAGVTTAVATLFAWLLWRIWRETLTVPVLEVDSSRVIDKHKLTMENRYIYIPRQKAHSEDLVQCYDPASMEYLGFVPALKPADVKEHVRLAREAQKEWAKSPFSQRRLFLRILQRYIVDNQEIICRASTRDSGKCPVDAEFGEIFTTLEKIAWLLQEGERWLRPENRSVGRMMLHKRARVEYHPLGVLGAIVPWNYPFHNIFNPMLAAVFSGNAIVIKVSEHTSWSADFYRRIIHGALRLAGAPGDLVHIITGYAETGEALVNSGIDKLTFVGSTAIGRKVMAAASRTLTPVVLELGGKDAFIVCEDADLGQVVPTALRAAFQSSGQNCVAAERFFVHAAIHDRFVEGVVEAAKQMTMGPPLEGHVDMGALCMPLQVERLQGLVDDALAKGARAAVGGRVPGDGLGGQFFPPTVLVGVDASMRVMQEEVFGPLLTVVRVGSDEEAVRSANESAFGLGCAVFSGSARRANRVAARVQCGMASINDFASTYMSQSLPFGGVKESGFGRFGGVEGLRGCCNIKAVQEDRWPWLKTRIPKPLQYPVAPEAFAFQQSLVRLFYGLSIKDKAQGLVGLLYCLMFPVKKSTAATDASC